jgi:hypothetical protein
MTTLTSSSKAAFIRPTPKQPHHHQPASNTRSRKGLPVIAWVGIGVGGFLGLIAVISAVIFLGIWSLTSGGADAANAFLSHVGNGQYEAAYRATAPQFRAQHSVKSFRTTMRRYGLDRYKSATWNSREITDGKVTLAGTILTREGNRIPATIIVIENRDKWMVYSLRLGAPGVNTMDASRPGTPVDVPNAAVLNKLLLKALLDFNAGVRKKDFRAFHASLARPLRTKFSPEQLKKAFEVFVRGQINIAAIRHYNPTFTQSPSIAKDGRLVVKGYYATKPKRVNFALSFVMEDGEWHLLGINVSLS